MFWNKKTWHLSVCPQWTWSIMCNVKNRYFGDSFTPHRTNQSTRSSRWRMAKRWANKDRMCPAWWAHRPVTEVMTWVEAKQIIETNTWMLTAYNFVNPHMLKVILLTFVLKRELYPRCITASRLAMDKIQTTTPMFSGTNSSMVLYSNTARWNRKL